jgi:hypothetical protein
MSSAFASSSLAGSAAPGAVPAIIVLNIRRGGCLCHQLPAMGLTKHYIQIRILCDACFMGKAQVAVIIPPTTASSQWWLCQLSESWQGRDGGEPSFFASLVI